MNIKWTIQLLIGNTITKEFKAIHTEEFESMDFGPFAFTRLNNIGKENITSSDEFYRINVFRVIDETNIDLVMYEIHKDNKLINRTINPYLEGKSCNIHKTPYQVAKCEDGIQITFGVCVACDDLAQQPDSEEYEL